jgi:6-phospho-3-hexuloisomerase
LNNVKEIVAQIIPGAQEGAQMAIERWRERMLQEVNAGLQATDDEVLELLLGELQAARRIFVFGQGREGYMLRAFTMRLMHLGLNAHYLWHPSLPLAGAGDLFVTSSGTGDLRTIKTLVEIAQEHGCRVAFMTAQPEAGIGALCDLVIHIPVKTMAEGQEYKALQPLGSVFEQVQLLWLDAVILHLIDAMGMDDEAMSRRHTNWE